MAPSSNCRCPSVFVIGREAENVRASLDHVPLRSAHSMGVSAIERVIVVMEHHRGIRSHQGKARLTHWKG